MSNNTLTIDTNAIQGAIQEATVKAISEAAGAWELQRAISAAAATELGRVDLPGLVSAAVAAELDARVGDIVTEAVTASMPALRAAVSASVQQAAVAMTYGLQQGRPGKYETEKCAAWQRAERAVTAADAPTEPADDSAA